MQKRQWIVISLGVVAASAARADEIPIITLSDVGPNQEVPTHRSFYVAGDAGPTVANAQALVVRKGTSQLLGDAGPDCHDLLAELRLDAITTSMADEDEDGDSDQDLAVPQARYDAGLHRVFELFPQADGGRDEEILVSAPWQRTDDTARQFKVLVPHDPDFFSAGHGYCLFVVTTERTQVLDDETLNELVDGIAHKIVGCGDKSSCDDEALADYEVKVSRELVRSHAVAAGAVDTGHSLAAQMKEAARAELGTATGLIEALDHMQERWHDKTTVMTPAPPVVWAETATDPFAQAVSTMLARAAALLPQVKTAKAGSSVALFTTDGKLQVKALQLLDDGRSIRVASSKSPTGEQARVLTATTDTLAVTDSLTLYDLIQLGHGKLRVDKDWIALTELGEKSTQLGLEQWTADDTAYLVAATAQLKRLADFVDLVTTGVSCSPKPFATTEAEQTTDAVRRHLGEWLVCQHTDASAIESLREQLDELELEDQSWKVAKDKLLQRSRKVVTITTTAPRMMRLSFRSRVWAFSYVTPIVGYAGVIRPDESFGLFYLGVQLHLEPNAVDDVMWRHGVTTRDLRRALALEIGVAPYGSGFGPEHRYGGPGALPPIFLGAAVHVIPYTSFTIGGAFVDRRNSTLAEEQPHTIFAPYIGFTLQLNVPDLIRQTAHPGTDTTATR